MTSRMKYKTFRNIIAAVVFFGMGGSCYACYGCWQANLAQEAAAEKQRSEERRREEVAREARRRAEEERQRALAQTQAANLTPHTPTGEAATSPGAYWSKASGLRDVDRDVLSALQRPVVDKIKDAARGKPYKLNVYADDAKRFNRVKVDLDRDEKEDESWTIFADGRIERKVSTKDDGTMDGHFILELSGWVSATAPRPTAATTATPTATTTTAGGPSARPVDLDMTKLRGSLGVVDKVKDATKGKPYKINLYSDDLKVFNRAKVDLDRDDKWDESWTWKGDSVERQVAPADDETYTEVYVWQGGAWAKKP